MKLLYNYHKGILLLFFLLYFLYPIWSQNTNCIYKGPKILIHFGQGKVHDINATPLPNYSRVSYSCPDDGYYTFTSATSDCFLGDWFTLNEDHTPGDKKGNMMLVNASPNGGTFFNSIINGIKENTSYEFSVWMMNVCRIRGGCPPLPPNIVISLITPNGKNIKEYHTGELTQTASPRWSEFKTVFTMPSGHSSLILTMRNNTRGGCGNDFAMDDVLFRECVKPNPVVTKTTVPIPGNANKFKEAKKKPEIKKELIQKQSVIKKKVPTIPLTKVDKVTNFQVKPDFKKKADPNIPLPVVLRTRDNQLVKEIETLPGGIKIDLYDNGEIDGDTVSIYHNGVLIVSEAALSQKPISFTIQVDATQPHHELIMVANNLGSIPPNTSLMMVSAKDQRHQVFISSSQQKNAKVIINLKE